MWKYIGEWGYPTKENKGYRQVVYHKCDETFDSEVIVLADRLTLTHCVPCGEAAPEGIMMIALLESL